VSKKDKPGSRWNVGNERYTTPQQAINNKLLREQPGWHRGAKVSRR
jgi:hypothetical protein